MEKVAPRDEESKVHPGSDPASPPYLFSNFRQVYLSLMGQIHGTHAHWWPCGTNYCDQQWRTQSSEKQTHLEMYRGGVRAFRVTVCRGILNAPRIFQNSRLEDFIATSRKDASQLKNIA